MLSSVHTPLAEFTGDLVHSLGVVTLRVYFGALLCQTDTFVDFRVVDAPSTYNAILGHVALNMLEAVVSTSRLMTKFPTRIGIGREPGDQVGASHPGLGSGGCKSSKNASKWVQVI
jgi:hypothetical protein